MKQLTGKAITGRCLCGAVCYQAQASISAPTLCHCASCRRASGAHVLGWLTVRATDFRILHGAPVTFTSSPGVRRTFCATCGSPLMYQHSARPGEIDVTIGTLDTPEDYPPADHTWMKDALPWDRVQDERPQHSQDRGK